MVVLRPRLVDAEGAGVGAEADPENTILEKTPLWNGIYVQLHNGYEPFWCKIIDTNEKDMYYGVISSRFQNKYSYSFGDMIQFHKRSIFRSSYSFSSV